MSGHKQCKGLLNGSKLGRNRVDCGYVIEMVEVSKKAPISNSVYNRPMRRETKVYVKVAGKQ